MTIHDYGNGVEPQSDEKTWNTAEMTAEFEVLGFSAPWVIVRRKSDGIKGTLRFTHSPRVYFRWQALDKLDK